MDKLIITYKGKEIEYLINLEHVFCPYCGNERQLKVETALNSGRVCKNRLCKGK